MTVTMKTYIASIDLEHMGQIEGLSVRARNKTEARQITKRFQATHADLRGKPILWIEEG
jgi:hypothetical protein